MADKDKNKSYSAEFAFTLDINISMDADAVKNVVISANAGDPANTVKSKIKSFSISADKEYTKMFITPYYMDGNNKIVTQEQLIAYVNKVMQGLKAKNPKKIQTSNLNYRVDLLKASISGVMGADNKISFLYDARKNVLSYARNPSYSKYIHIEHDKGVETVKDAFGEHIVTNLTPYFDIEIFSK